MFKVTKKRGIVLFFSFILFGVLIAFLVMHFGINKSVKSKISNDVSVFKSGDIGNINRLLFFDSQIPDEVSNYVETVSEGSGEGIVSVLIAYSDIEFISRDESTVILSVTAPDMSSFGDAVLPTISSETTENELKKILIEYAEDTVKVTHEVTLNYVKNDNEINILYNNTEFLNAVTGNLSKGYEKIYYQYLFDLTSWRE